jgi:hypothetical protein
MEAVVPLIECPAGEDRRQYVSRLKAKVNRMSNEHLIDPKPGSPEAIAQDCTCPPQTGPDFVCDPNCPVHGAADWVEPWPHGHIDPAKVKP